MVNASERKKDPCWEMGKELEIEKEHEIVMEPEMEQTTAREPAMDEQNVLSLDSELGGNWV